MTKLYDELVSLEKGDRGSPCQEVHRAGGVGEILSGLPKGRPHGSPMLFFGQDKGSVEGFAGMAGRPEGTAVLEDGWSYHCAHL